MVKPHSYIIVLVTLNMDQICNLMRSFKEIMPTFGGMWINELTLFATIAISIILASISLPLSGRLLSASCFHSHFIQLLLSPLLTPTIIFTRLFFANLDVSLLFLCWCHRLQSIHVCRSNTRAEHISFTFMWYVFISHHPFEFHPKRLP